MHYEVCIFHNVQSLANSDSATSESEKSINSNTFVKFSFKSSLAELGTGDDL